LKKLFYSLSPVLLGVDAGGTFFFFEHLQNPLLIRRTAKPTANNAIITQYITSIVLKVFEKLS